MNIRPFLYADGTCLTVKVCADDSMDQHWRTEQFQWLSDNNGKIVQGKIETHPELGIVFRPDNAPLVLYDCEIEIQEEQDGKE